MLRNEKGFTLIEIIAVLVILGILAAVAIPKYISLMDESRTQSAYTAIAEVQARASNFYALNLLKSVTPNGCGEIKTLVDGSIPAGKIGDFTVNTGTCASSQLPINVTAVKDITVAVSGTWTLPQ